MTRQLTCADVTGDCDAVVTGETDEEILEQAGNDANLRSRDAPSTAASIRRALAQGLLLDTG